MKSSLRLSGRIGRIPTTLVALIACTASCWGTNPYFETQSDFAWAQTLSTTRTRSKNGPRRTQPTEKNQSLLSANSRILPSRRKLDKRRMRRRS